MSLMLKFSWEMLFFESGDTEVLKLIEISCLQVIKGKLTVRLTIRLLDMLHSYMSVMCTYHCRGVFKKVFFSLHKATSRVEEYKTIEWCLLGICTYCNHIFKLYSTWLHDVFNPLHPNVRMHALCTVLYIFPNVLARRICLTIKRFLKKA